MNRADEEYTARVQDLLPRLRRTAYLLCSDWYRADDLVQSTITQLYVKWRRARTADNLDAYVRTMLSGSSSVSSGPGGGRGSA